MGWLFLALAIVLELSGTVSMKLSDSFTRLVPSVLMFAFYGASFTFLNFALGYMKVSTVYAVWSGVGIVLISLAGSILFQEKLSVPSILWIGVIVLGVIGLNLSGKGG
ncbi:putative membrane protein YvaE [Paenibacillus antibioticophila]|jgi:small multidrug resistance pump|uniref:Membrane protein YvaE n=1 Tax=Paenibacillus antibioticophila TaxID=1274374 RepID=A0A919XSA2_9BACL|nr:multidrug efflux SMR transporter [Paenibacillus antibioticophila]GIO38104.1 putative membrane protein YvaE [Paenibacillus antibioticophila]GJM77825.1 putative membrane protein YvaE [Paenibacillus sp. HMSSN-139]